MRKGSTTRAKKCKDQALKVGHETMEAGHEKGMRKGRATKPKHAKTTQQKEDMKKGRATKANNTKLRHEKGKSN